jgi:hypothetical protein
MTKTHTLVLTLAASLTATTPAPCFDNGGWGDVDPHVRAWFKSVKSPNGIPCCDISDGHGTDEDLRADGSTWIPNPVKDGEWIEVPKDKIVYEAGNPTGRAVVWWIPWAEGGGIMIRCFVHGGGV